MAKGEMNILTFATMLVNSVPYGMSRLLLLFVYRGYCKSTIQKNYQIYTYEPYF